MAEAVVEIVERQVRRWEIDRGAGMPQPRGAVVAVARQVAAGGDEVARRVAEWLDYGFFGAEEVECIAGDASLRTRLAVELEGPARAAIEGRVAEVCAVLAGAGEAGFREQVEVVATLAERGMAVLVGRGAASIARPARVLRVLVVAPAALRAARLGERDGLEPETARARLAELDARRADWLARHLGVAADDATRFDLVVNTERLTLDGAAALVVEGLRRRFPRI